MFTVTLEDDHKSIVNYIRIGHVNNSKICCEIVTLICISSVSHYFQKEMQDGYGVGTKTTFIPISVGKTTSSLIKYSFRVISNKM